MPLRRSGFDHQLDRGFAFNKLQPATVRARLLMHNAAAIAHRTHLGVGLRRLADSLAKGGVRLGSVAGRALLDGFGVASACAVADGAQLLALDDHVDGDASDEGKQWQLDVVVCISSPPVFPLLVSVVPALELHHIRGAADACTAERTFQIRCRGTAAS